MEHVETSEIDVSSRATRRELAAEYLAEGSKIAEVAKRLGVSKPTIKRWKGEDEFKAMVKSARDEIVSKASNAMKASALKAANLLIGIVTGEEEADSVRRLAANDILDRVGLAKPKEGGDVNVTVNSQTNVLTTILQRMSPDELETYVEATIEEVE